MRVWIPEYGTSTASGSLNLDLLPKLFQAENHIRFGQT
jgi:hypothetical protein